MNKVKVFIFGLALALSAGVFGANNVSAAAVQINDVSGLVSAMSNGGEAILNADITLDYNRAISNPFVLDLNGHTITTGDKTIVVRSDFTLKDSVGTGAVTGNESFIFIIGDTGYTGTMTMESGLVSAEADYGIETINGELILNGGKIYAPEFAVYNYGKFTINGGLVEAASVESSDPAVGNRTGGVIEMNGGKVVALGAGVGIANSFDYGDHGEGTGIGSTLIVNDGEISAIGTGGSAVTAYKNCSVTINGGTLISDSTALISNGSISGKSEGTNAKFTITGGEIISNSGPAIYAPQPNGETTISGGVLHGQDSAIEIRAGSANITGGTFISDATTYVVNSNSNGSTTKGAAVAIAQHNTMLPIEVHICGGHFRAVVPLSITNPQGNDAEAVAQVSASIDQPCGELYFESTGDSSVVFENAGNVAIRGGIFDYSVADYLGEGYGERATDDGRLEVLRQYNLRTVANNGGELTISQTKAFEGDTINVDAEPDLAYEVKRLAAVGGSGTEAQISNDEFTMPAENVTVAATFGFVSSPAPAPEPIPTWDEPDDGPEQVPAAAHNKKAAAVEYEEINENGGIVVPNTSDDLAIYIVTLFISGFGLTMVVPKPRKN